jgi:MFS family permease
VALFDLAAVMVALPSVGREGGLDIAALQWLIVAPLVGISAGVVPGTSIAEVRGRRPTFVVAAIAYGLTSFLAAWAPTPMALTVARAAQGFAIALLLGASLAVARPVSGPADRQYMERWWAGGIGAHGVIGVVLGGWLTVQGSWKWIFWVGGAWSIVLAVLGTMTLSRELVKRRRATVDGMGSVTLLAAVAGAAFVLVQGPVLRWSDPKVLAAGALAMIAAVGFVDLQRSQARPLLPLRVLFMRRIWASLSATMLVHVAMAGVVFVLVFHLYRTSGFTSVDGTWAGASLLVAFLVAYVASVGIGEQPGARSWAIAGVGASVVGLFLLADVGPTSEYSRDILPGTVLTGLGCGLALAFEAGAVHASFGQRLGEVAARVALAGAAMGGMLGVTLLPLLGGLVGADALGAADFAEAYRQSMKVAVVALGLAAVLIWISEPSTSSERGARRRGS